MLVHAVSLPSAPSYGLCTSVLLTGFALRAPSSLGRWFSVATVLGPILWRPHCDHLSTDFPQGRQSPLGRLRGQASLEPQLMAIDDLLGTWNPRISCSDMSVISLWGYAEGFSRSFLLRVPAHFSGGEEGGGGCVK